MADGCLFAIRAEKGIVVGIDLGSLYMGAVQNYAIYDIMEQSGVIVYFWDKCVLFGAEGVDCIKGDVVTH